MCSTMCPYPSVLMQENGSVPVVAGDGAGLLFLSGTVSQHSRLSTFSGFIF
jgi:hypothetical protein